MKNFLLVSIAILLPTIGTFLFFGAIYAILYSIVVP